MEGIYRVTLSRQEYYTVDVVAKSKEDAETKLAKQIDRDENFIDTLEAYDNYDYVVEGETYQIK